MANESDGKALAELSEFLEALDPGPIKDSTKLGKLLVHAWDLLAGSDASGMEASKLVNRMEMAVWSPPHLTFRIERHGGTVRGSSRAELQNWRVDLGRQEAQLAESGVRQLSPMAAPLDLAPLAEGLAEQIASKTLAPELVWLPEGAVRVLIGKILPAGSAVPQTLAGRRKRFWSLLAARLEPQGWLPTKRGTFEKRTSTPHTPGRRA